MIQLPSIILPPEFCQLLSSDMDKISNGQTSYDSLYKTINRSESLTMLVENNFSHLYPTGKVQHFLRSLGWKNFRDRLASVYLLHGKLGKFPGYTSLEAVEDILFLEAVYEKFAVNRYSKLFQFLFYLEMAKQKLAQTKEGKSLVPLLTIPEKILPLLQMARQKLLHIDWIILLLWHFDGPAQKVMQEKNKETQFSLVWDVLTEEERKILVTNFITYSFATGDETPFLRHL